MGMNANRLTLFVTLSVLSSHTWAWGAAASAPGSHLGVVVNLTTASYAEKMALHACETNGGGNKCRLLGTPVSEKAIVIAVNDANNYTPQQLKLSHDVRYFFASNKDPEKAKDDAMKQCIKKKTAKQDCRVQQAIWDGGPTATPEPTALTKIHNEAEAFTTNMLLKMVTGLTKDGG